MIAYDGKREFKDKIDDLLNEMYSDEEYIYHIKIDESRENEHLKGLTITTIEIRSSIPEF